MTNDESDNDEQYNDFVKKYIWLVRPCVDYQNEVKECKAIRGRFHQYFLYGEFLDCSKWNQDSQNCSLCVDKKNNEACKSIIRNETERRLKRISDSKQNDVWKKRDKPPENWNKPLPKYFVDMHKQFVLSEKADEFNEYITSHEPNKKYSCTIL